MEGEEQGKTIRSLRPLHGYVDILRRPMGLRGHALQSGEEACFPVGPWPERGMGGTRFRDYCCFALGAVSGFCFCCFWASSVHGGTTPTKRAYAIDWPRCSAAWRTTNRSTPRSVFFPPNQSRRLSRSRSGIVALALRAC